MNPDEQSDPNRAESDAEAVALQQQVANLTKQLSAQRDAYDRRGRALIALQNDVYRLQTDPLTRMLAATAQGHPNAQPQSSESREREVRFQETAALTRRLMDAETQLADVRRRLNDRRLLGLVGKLRALARKLLRRLS